MLAQASRTFDLVALGEVMLRLDPGEGRIATTRTFRVWEGGGEYNVARGLRRVFGLRTAIVTALANNPVGRLVEDLMLQGGVDLRHLRWTGFDGVGRAARNGLNFTERGFGPRAPLGVYDRGHTPASQMRPGEIDWDAIMRETRWFHTGGIFVALSASTPGVAREAMEAAKRHGVTVSYDLNYRPSLWKTLGGREAATEVNRTLMPFVDVLFASPEEVQALMNPHESFEVSHPTIKIVASTMRVSKSATHNFWSATLLHEGRVHQAPNRPDLEILDRVGGGDGFASGLIYGLLSGKGPQWAVECGAAHGALAMSTPGDNSMATLDEVLRLMEGGDARAER